MTKFELNLAKREDAGSSSSRRLRKAGQVPTVVYSANNETISCTMTVEAWESFKKSGKEVASLNLDGKTIEAKVQDVQHNYLKNETVHVDFKAV